MLPVTATLMFGWAFSNAATIALKASFSEPCEKPSQSLMVTGGLLAGYGSAAVMVCVDPPVLPAQAAAVRLAATAAAMPEMRRGRVTVGTPSRIRGAGRGGLRRCAVRCVAVRGAT